MNFTVTKYHAIAIFPLIYLLLEGKDMRDTAINRVMKTSLSFVGDGDNSFTSIMDWNIKQELRDVACSKHLVNSCKSCCSLLR